MIRSNCQYVSELQRRVGNERIAHEIIFLDTLLGAYYARQELGEQALARRTITSFISEAEYIAAQREKTLKQFREYPPESVLENLRLEAEGIAQSSFKEGLYALLNQFLNDEGKIYRAGKGLSIKLSNTGLRIRPDMEEREVKNVFLEERNTMQRVLIHEIEMSNHRR